MTPFGYTVLGFGSGVSAGEVPIAEDLTYSATDTGVVTQASHSIAMCPYNANKCLVMYAAQDADGHVASGTIDGDTITWGTIVEFSDKDSQAGYCAFDPSTENSFVVVWRDSWSAGGGAGRAHAAAAGTLSGTAITIGSKVDIATSGTLEYVLETNCMFNPNRAGQVVSLSPNADNTTRSGAAEVKSLTVSGTGISLDEMSVVHTTDTTRQCELAWDMEDSDQFFMMYVGSGDYNYVRPATVAADGTFTLGTEHTLDSAGGAQVLQCIASDWNNAGRIVVTYGKSGRRYVYARVGNLSGGTITWGTEVELDDVGGGGEYINASTVQMDKNTPIKFIAVWDAETAGDALTAVVGTISGTNTITLGTPVTSVMSGNAWKRVRSCARDPFNPGRFFSAIVDSQDSEQLHIIGHQVASTEL